MKKIIFMTIAIASHTYAATTTAAAAKTNINPNSPYTYVAQNDGATAGPYNVVPSDIQSVLTLSQTARKIKIKAISVSQATVGMSQTDQQTLAHVYLVRYGANMWTDPTITH